jgi:CRP-like cAMP-binding protein
MKIENLLLRALPMKERRRLWPRLERVELNIRDLVYDKDKKIEYTYFPEAGVISLVSEMKNGSVVEIGTVGKEGMVGIPAFLGATSTPVKAFAQVSGRALRMRAADLKQEAANGTALHGMLHRYTQALFTQLSQAVACNRLHSVEQRCARWLLMTVDRVDERRFKLTQEFIAQMLGVRRATVNPILAGFQRAGMLRYRRGVMQIQNRRKLEKASCECYQIVRREYRKLTQASG